MGTGSKYVFLCPQISKSLCQFSTNIALIHSVNQKAIISQYIKLNKSNEELQRMERKKIINDKTDKGRSKKVSATGQPR